MPARVAVSSSADRRPVMVGERLEPGNLRPVGRPGEHLRRSAVGARSQAGRRPALPSPAASWSDATTVGAHLGADVVSPIDLVLPWRPRPTPVVEESLVVTLDGVPIAVDELPGTTDPPARRPGVAAGGSWSTTPPRSRRSRPWRRPGQPPRPLPRPGRYSGPIACGRRPLGVRRAHPARPPRGRLELPRARLGYVAGSSRRSTLRRRPASLARASAGLRAPRDRVPRACDVPARLVSVSRPASARWTSTRWSRPRSTAR